MRSAKRAEGSTWGSSDAHGTPIRFDYSDAESTGIRKVFTTKFAFAALKGNGSVLTWGCKKYEGEIPDEIQRKIDNLRGTDDKIVK